MSKEMERLSNILSQEKSSSNSSKEALMELERELVIVQKEKQN